MMNKTPFSLDGAHVGVVGAAGLLGHAIMQACRLSGAKVTALDVEGSMPDDPDFRAFDVTHFAKPSEVIDALEQERGAFTVWINSSYPRTSDWGTPEGEAASSVESWQANIDMQLNSTCVWATEMAERMAKRGGGAIVGVSSIYGMVAPDETLYEGLNMGTPAAYAVIKGGVIAHTRMLASRFAPTVRANVVCPGGIERNQPDAFLERYNKKTPLGRMARAEEIAWPIVFLASEAASYMTGNVMEIDGGFTAI